MSQVVQVLRYKSDRDDELFKTAQEAEAHCRLLEGIERANEAYWKGASLWHIAKYITDPYSEWARPHQLLKLVSQDFLIQGYETHLSVKYIIGKDLALSICQHDIYENYYSWNGPIYHFAGLGQVIRLLKEHYPICGYTSAEPAKPSRWL